MQYRQQPQPGTGENPSHGQLWRGNSTGELLGGGQTHRLQGRGRAGWQRGGLERQGQTKLEPNGRRHE